MIRVFQKFIRKNIYLITYKALTSKPLMICNFCFGYLLIRYYQSLMLNIDEIRDVRVTNLEILFTFLYSISYIYIYILIEFSEIEPFKKMLKHLFSSKISYRFLQIFFSSNRNIQIIFYQFFCQMSESEKYYFIHNF